VRRDRDPALREAARGAGLGGLILLCVSLATAAIIAGYVIVSALVRSLH
jgi:hypothetical protein